MRKSNKALYEKIMQNVAKEVKRASNEDTGYGYRDGMAYDYADGTYVDGTDMSYTQFQIRAENAIRNYVENNDNVFGYSLVEKANETWSTWEEVFK